MTVNKEKGEAAKARRLSIIPEEGRPNQKQEQKQEQEQEQKQKQERRQEQEQDQQ